MIDDVQKPPEEVLSTAVEEHSPDSVYALVSGGNDSTTAAHVAKESGHVDLDGILYIDTGIGVPESKLWVQEWADTVGLQYHQAGSQYRPEWREYHNLIVQTGFPGPVAHQYMWINLKEAPLKNWLQENTSGDTLLITGIRSHESERRAEITDDSGIEVKDEAVYASPLIDFTDDDLAEYRDQHADELYENPVTAKLHSSGDCLCGAYADREELRELQLFYPNVADYISYLEGQVLTAAEQGRVGKQYALWGHGSDDQQIEADHHQTGLSLCQACTNRTEEGYEQTGVALTDAEAKLRGQSIHTGLEADSQRADGNDNCLELPAFCVHCQTLVTDPVGHRLDCPNPPRNQFGSKRSWRDHREIDPLETQYRGLYVTEPSPRTTEYCQREDGHDWTTLPAGQIRHPSLEGSSEALPVDGRIAVCDTCDAYCLGGSGEPNPPWFTEYTESPPSEEGASELIATDSKTTPEGLRSLDQFTAQTPDSSQRS